MFFECFFSITAAIAGELCAERRMNVDHFSGMFSSFKLSGEMDTSALKTKNTTDDNPIVLWHSMKILVN